MNSLRALLAAALFAALAVSCNSDDPLPYVQPQVELNKPYQAVRINSEGIHIGVKDKWLVWEQDSVIIKEYRNRVIGEENDPGFLPTTKTLPVAQPQQLVFAENGQATLTENGENTVFSYQTVNQSALLWLRQRDTLSYYENEKHVTISKLGHFSPTYFQKELATDNEAYKYKVRTVAERYFYILTSTGELQAPGIIYHIKTYDGVQEYGQMQNYLGDQQAILNSIPLGDTLLIQLYQMEYAY